MREIKVKMVSDQLLCLKIACAQNRMFLVKMEIGKCSESLSSDWSFGRKEKGFGRKRGGLETSGPATLF